MEFIAYTLIAVLGLLALFFQNNLGKRYINHLYETKKRIEAEEEIERTKKYRNYLIILILIICFIIFTFLK